VRGLVRSVGTMVDFGEVFGYCLTAGTARSGTDPMVSHDRAALAGGLPGTP